MGWILLVLIIGLPVVEITVFVKVAGLMGFLPAVGLAVVSGILGMALLRGQGLSTALRARSLLDKGVMPVAEVFDGICLMVAGGLLLFPGFVSDIAGLILLLPPVRAALRSWLVRRMPAEDVAPFGAGRTGAAGPGVIEGEFHEVPDPDAPAADRLEHRPGSDGLNGGGPARHG